MKKCQLHTSRIIGLRVAFRTPPRRNTTTTLSSYSTRFSPPRLFFSEKWWTELVVLDRVYNYCSVIKPTSVVKSCLIPRRSFKLKILSYHSSGSVVDQPKIASDSIFGSRLQTSQTVARQMRFENGQKHGIIMQTLPQLITYVFIPCREIVFMLEGSVFQV